MPTADEDEVLADWADYSEEQKREAARRLAAPAVVEKRLAQRLKARAESRAVAMDYNVRSVKTGDPIFPTKLILALPAE